MNTFLIIPNIDYTQLNNAGKTDISNYNQDKLLEVLNVIITSRNKIQLKESEDDTYTNINHVYFKSISNDYKAYINLLISFEIITCDEIFIPEVKSLGYCINWHSLSYIDALPIQFIECKKSISSYKEEEDNNKDILDNNNNKINSRNLINPSLEYWLSKLKIDFPSSLALASELLIQRKLVPDTKQVYIKPNNAHKRGRYETREKNRFNQLSIELLNAKLISCSMFEIKRDSNIYRVHTTLTKLNKKYRPLLSIDGKKLVSIDLANSQPYLLLALLNSSFWSFNGSNLNLSSIGFFLNDIVQTKIKDVLKLLSKINSMPDTIEYKSSVSNGKLYQLLHEFLNKTKSVISDKEKAIIKPIFYIIFYANNYVNSDELKHFKTLFPNIYKLISLLKRHSRKELNKELKKISYKLLSKILQRIESYLFIDIISNRILLEHPEIPIITLHDSILTTVEYKAIVADIIKEELIRHIGASPTLHIEDF